MALAGSVLVSVLASAFVSVLASVFFSAFVSLLLEVSRELLELEPPLFVEP